MNKFLILLTTATFILVYSNVLSARPLFLGMEKEQLVLRGGVNIVGTKAFTGKQSTTFPGAGVNTQFGHLWKKWEVIISSYAYFGEIKDIEFQFDDQAISGQGKISSVSFGPLLRYYTKFSYNPKYSFYTTLGPIWSLESIKLYNTIDEPKKSSDNDDWLTNHKITYESFGLFFSLGLHERTKRKEEHPLFYELAYTYQRAHHISYVDITNRAKVKVLNHQQTRQFITGHTIYLSVGITIF